MASNHKLTRLLIFWDALQLDIISEKTVCLVFPRDGHTLSTWENCMFSSLAEAAALRGEVHPSQRSRGHVWHLIPTCANWHLATRKHTAVGMPPAIMSARLCGGGSSPPEASQNPHRGFPHFTGWLEHTKAELQPTEEGSKPPVQHSPCEGAGSDESLPWRLLVITFPLHIFRSITFATAVGQTSAEQRWIATPS